MASKTPQYDAKIKDVLDKLEPGERVCKLTGDKFELTEFEIDWLKKFKVPPSKLAPMTRWAHRAAFWLGLQMWYNQDYRTGEPILTHIHPATKWKIMPDQDWFQEDFSSINLELDSSQSVFTQLEELAWQVPINAYRHFDKPKNSISLCSLGDEDSYFVIAVSGRRNFFSSDSINLEDTMEAFVCHQIDRSFNVVHSYRISDSKVVRESLDCFNCQFIFDCRNCENCFFAWNKRNKKYLWFNEQLSEAEWKKRIAEIDTGRRSVYNEYFNQFRDIVGNQAVWPENFNVRSEDCTGDYLVDCVECTRGFFCERARNCHYCVFGHDTQDMYHADGPYCSNSYMASPIVRCENNKFTWSTVDCINIEYCINCYNCEFCFGCIGLNKKKYCLFNKQYSADEYWAKLDEIKCAMLDRGEYGYYFPLSLVQGYVPATGLRWMFGLNEKYVKAFDYPDFEPKDAGAFGPLAERLDEARDPADLPDNIDDLDESWINVPILDKERGRPYSLLSAEVKYCQKYRIPAGNQHFLSRFWDASSEMNIANLVAYKCSECSKEIQVSENRTYPDRKVYCTPCYLKYLEQYG